MMHCGLVPGLPISRSVSVLLHVTRFELRCTVFHTMLCMPVSAQSCIHALLLYSFCPHGIAAVFYGRRRCIRTVASPAGRNAIHFLSCLYSKRRIRPLRAGKSRICRIPFSRTPLCLPLLSQRQCTFRCFRNRISACRQSILQSTANLAFPHSAAGKQKSP